MARRLLAAGIAVVGFDPDRRRSEELATAGGSPVDDPHQVAAAADVVLLSLPDDSALAATVAVLTSVPRPGTVVIDTSTLSAAAKQAAEVALAEHAMAFVDAPVSGTGRQAEAGELVMMASGAAEGVERARAVAAAFTREVWDVGGVPNGTLFKYVANLLVAVHTVAAAEAHALAAATGLDAELVQRVIAAGVGSSRMWEIRGPMMVAGRFEPPAARLDVLVKDVGLIAGHADQAGLDAPLLAAARRIFERAAGDGWGSHDAAAVRRVYSPRSRGDRGDLA